MYKIAKDAASHSMANAYIGRKNKKRDMRSLWQIKINAGARENGMPYNKLINSLKNGNVELDRKVLAELAEHEPEVFAKVVEKVK